MNGWVEQTAQVGAEECGCAGPPVNQVLPAKAAELQLCRNLSECDAGSLDSLLAEAACAHGRWVA